MNPAALHTREENDLFAQHMYLVKFVALKMRTGLPHSIEVEDLVSYGMIGLIDAIKKYDPSRENLFKTYAEFRIRGAMLDHLRENDVMARSVREREKELNHAIGELTVELGRTPFANEIAEHLAVTTDDVHVMRVLAAPVTLVSIDSGDGFNESDRRSILEAILGGETVEDRMVNRIDHKRKLELVASYILRQTPRNQRILEAYFFKAERMHVIGAMERISESRISQIIARHTLNLTRLIDAAEA